MPLIIAGLLGLAALVVVIYPLLGLERPLQDGGLPAPVAELAERERLARTALREVEFDHSLGNLDDGDYQALRERYERRALAALKVRYQREQELDARIERELAELRTRIDRGQADVRASAELTGEASPEASPSARPAVRMRATRPEPQGPRTRRRRGV
jgi:cytochrome c-type biogenesis protein CcmI